MLILKKKKFFPVLIEYATWGPVYAMVLEDDYAVFIGHKTLGATKLFDSKLSVLSTL